MKNNVHRLFIVAKAKKETTTTVVEDIVSLIMKIIRLLTGVSASHLDWTMEPYVKKSFRKHWNAGARYLVPLLEDFPADWSEVNEPYSISEYPNDDICAPVYNYALEQTIKELNQAVEGMFHNLNSLQSRSGN